MKRKLPAYRLEKSEPPPCPCLSPVPCELVKGDVVYGDKAFYDVKNRNFWLCRACGRYIGCHIYTEIPLGIPADLETRKARRLAHAMFDPLWKSGSMSRGKAYKWLREQMGREDKIHIAALSLEDLRRVVDIISAHVGSKAIR